jgi:hypothetical protein
MDDHPATPVPNIAQGSRVNALTGNVASTTVPPAQAPSRSGGRSTGWTQKERQTFIDLMDEHISRTPAGTTRLYDTHLFEFISAQLRQRYGISRNPGACKNEWSRRLRSLTGIDERKVKNPDKLATSIQ